ncbi:MAG: transglycosylase SLT domain-containing protein [Sulfurimonas sp.]|uniref:transglycosylase SLT domain-containing protein n=1 Tax=Sulfurimonas sp. TaxID=2022749 RepID=UPI002620A26A|nr:transglycosylase SLT domain-containing protein [Sulfurimonas sp.]MDD5373295.1 transglycosylase SLT domain-containing protein [Sulfurimonas sp.]
MRNLFLFLFFSFSLFGFENKRCSLKEPVVLAVLEAESHPKKELGYQYLISFNNKEEARLVKKYLPKYFIDSRTMDCENIETCALLTKKLFESGFYNLDLGAFQINSYHHKYPIEDYFNYEKSYKTACGYLEKMIGKYGYNWFAIASYNSQSVLNNVKYQHKLIDNYFEKR